MIEERTGVLWRMPGPSAPGIYRVLRRQTPVFALASTLPAQDESDLRPIGASVLQGRLTGGRQVQYRDATSSERPRDDLWTWLLTACVGCMLAELLALRIFRT